MPELTSNSTFAFPQRCKKRNPLSCNLCQQAFLLLAICVAATVAFAQTPKTLVLLDGTNGDAPYGTLAQGFNGNLYSTTRGGPSPYLGTIFAMTPGGDLNSLLNFGGTEGTYPVAGLVLATNGNLYGTTNQGGDPSCDCGTVFEVTPAGTLTTLHPFTGYPTDGQNPSGLIQASNGNLYGTTYGGGAHGYGSVFEITPAGKLTMIYSFCSVYSKGLCADGTNPEAGLVQATNGELYGTTFIGGVGTGGTGTVFKITTGGVLTTLHSFNGPEGSAPYAGLVQATNGILYGGTTGGGANGYGTLFEITPAGVLTKKHDFDKTDGYEPRAAMMQATDGNLYGMTLFGGANAAGSLFELTPAGAFTSLYSFCSQSGCDDGDFPYGGLFQATTGLLYGLTSGGGNFTCNGGCGTVFTWSIGEIPFLETLYTSGKVGATVKILGTNLAGTTSVTFNGAAATIESVSASEIKTTVPAGATTGNVVASIPTRSSSISTCTWSDGTSTCTVASAKGFGIGYPLTITAVTPSGFNVSSTQISGITNNQISYALATDPGTYTSGGAASEPSVNLSSKVVFRVTPQITSFSPPDGPVGTVVTITGVSLTQTKKVAIGGVSAHSTVVDDTTVTAIVPPTAVTGKIAVTTAGGTAASTSLFTVTP